MTHEPRSFDEGELRAALRLLAERAPQTCTIGETEALDAHRTLRPARLAVAVAGALLVLIAVGAVAYGVSRRSSGGTGPAAGSTRAAGATVSVTCTAPTGADSSPDRDALSARVRAMDGQVVSVTSRAATITLGVRGIAADDLGQVCTEGVLQVRNLVAAPVPVTCSADCSATAVADAARLGRFAVPTSDTAFDALSATQRHSVTTALARTDCTATSVARPAAAGGTVACGLAGGIGGGSGRVAVLLGPAVVGSADVSGAAAIAPSAQQGRVGWSVGVTLTDAGRGRLGAWTAAHNVDGDATAPDASRCSASSGSSASAGSSASSGSSSPCGDYLSFAVDNSVLSLPVTLERIDGATVQLAARFDEATARALAAELAGGVLPVPLVLDGVR